MDLRAHQPERPVSETASPFEGRTPVASLRTADGAGVVTLVEGQTFCLSGRTGDVSADFAHGLFVLDTRVLARWDLRVNGYRLEPLTVDVVEPFEAVFVGRGHPPPGRADAELVVFRRRHVGGGMREAIEVTNHGLDPVVVSVEVACDADFADLFEVKEQRVATHGEVAVSRAEARLTYTHRNGSVPRWVTISASRPAVVHLDGLTWSVPLAPGQRWEVDLEVRVGVGEAEVTPRFTAAGDGAPTISAHRLATWRATLPDVDTDHAGLAEAVQRAGEDLGALRIFDPDHPEVPILAAGAPWFMTVFGRDSLLTAWMALLADPSLAAGVLETLARFQGAEVVADTEEEPGRILHEIRFGATGGLSLGGGDIYYGTVDATPLFVMLLGELRRWAPGSDLVDRLLPHADRALAWIAEHGDRDGDGYVEYARQTERGLANQGWKDSWDAVRHADGALAEGPIALCEVQGYTYAAYVARARLAAEAGDQVTLQRYRHLAEDLRRRFNEDFWVDELGCYALGLDGDKRPIATVASNMAHCLWTGIVDPARSAQVAGRLLAPDVFSGWGIRTLSTAMPAYNPVSYHNGSVWPHDNAIAAAGLARYGHLAEAFRIIEGQVAVAASHHGRLPELFAGFERGNPPSPAAYPTSCSPQAWAAASPLLWLRTLLRLEPDTARGRVRVAPVLPSWLGRLQVSGITVADRRVTVTVEGDQVDVDGLEPLALVREPRPPVTALPSLPAR